MPSSTDRHELQYSEVRRQDVKAARMILVVFNVTAMSFVAALLRSEMSRALCALSVMSSGASDWIFQRIIQRWGIKTAMLVSYLACSVLIVLWADFPAFRNTLVLAFLVGLVHPRTLDSGLAPWTGELDGNLVLAISAFHVLLLILVGFFVGGLLLGTLSNNDTVWDMWANCTIAFVLCWAVWSIAVVTSSEASLNPAKLPVTHDRNTDSERSDSERYPSSSTPNSGEPVS